MVKEIEGGVCAAQGFTAGGVHCGIRKNRDKQDLGLLYSSVPCAAAGVYTQNKAKGAPILVTQAHLQNGYVQGVVCNSGIANTCAADGMQTAEAMCRGAAEALGIAAEDVAVASTGVIGMSLPMDVILPAMPTLARGLSPQGGGIFAEAIMTTDTRRKEVAATFTLGGKTCHIGGCAKGSGMIHPNMATMLGFVTTDAAIAPVLLQSVLKEVADETFNMVSVDGDTSTNDTLLVLANGLAGNAEITAPGADCDAFKAALLYVCTGLSKMMAQDGEGATKLVECSLCGAPDAQTARVLARAVISSSLVKAAMFGADANWGRILCALGNVDAPFDINKAEVAVSSEAGQVTVCQNGAGVPFSEEEALAVLQQTKVDILINLHQGQAQATAWGCDLTYDYVKINGDYRT